MHSFQTRNLIPTNIVTSKVISLFTEKTQALDVGSLNPSSPSKCVFIFTYYLCLLSCGLFFKTIFPHCWPPPPLSFARSFPLNAPSVFLFFLSALIPPKSQAYLSFLTMPLSRSLTPLSHLSFLHSSLNSPFPVAHLI